MALRKPLVLVGGQIQQIQAGDTLNATIAENETQSWTNGDVGSHSLGSVVYLSAADTVKMAKANAASTATPVAIATGTITNGAVGAYQSSGTLAGLTGLTAGATYYLDPTTAGAMTSTAPTTAGQLVVELGVAVSTTEFLIRIRTSILL
jgi:transcription elongation factor